LAERSLVEKNNDPQSVPTVDEKEKE
jgi:hypothetical protein